MESKSTPPTQPVPEPSRHLWVVADGRRVLGPGWRCPDCDYDLRGLRDPRCPKCGMRFAIRQSTILPASTWYAIALAGLNLASIACLLFFMFAKEPRSSFLPSIPIITAIRFYIALPLSVVFGLVSIFVGVHCAMARSRSWVLILASVVPVVLAILTLFAFVQS